MASFLVETYMPSASGLNDVEVRLARAANELSVEGSNVRLVRSIYVAEDEICFHLFDATSADAVKKASAQALVHPQRVVETIETLGKL
jgi:hypothetical protein